MTTDTGKLEDLLGQEAVEPRARVTVLPHMVPGRSSFTRLADILLMVAVFFAGYHLWRLDNANLTLSDIAFITAFALFIAQGRVNMVPFGLMTPLWLAALSLMLGGLFFSTLFDGDLLRWIVVAGQYLFAFFCIPIVLTALPFPRVRLLVLIFVLGVTAMQLAGGIASLTLDYQAAEAMLGDDFIGGNGRLGSFAGEPNWNGSLIAVAFPMLVYCVKERLIAAPLGIVCGAILAWGLLLSASATGFAASVIAVSILLLMLGARHVMRALLIGTILASIFVASGAPLPSIFSKRVGGAISSGNISEAGTYTGRVRLMKEAWRMSEDTALIGVGVDEFRNHSATHQPVHNLYLLFWTEGGIVALIGLLLLLGLMVFFPIAHMGVIRSEAAVALSIVVVFLIYTMASPHIYARLSVMPLILALALIYGRRDVLH